MLYQKLWNVNQLVKIIGSRHGEKFHETLLTKEELNEAIEFKNYFKISSDNRDLNYEKFFSKGIKGRNKNDYTSENTKRLSINDTKKLLTPILKLYLKWKLL